MHRNPYVLSEPERLVVARMSDQTRITEHTPQQSQDSSSVGVCSFIMPTRTTAGSSSSGRIVTLLLLVVVSTLLLLVVTEALVLPSPKEENKDDDETAFLLRLEEMNQNVLFQHVDSTESTQEECKRIVEEEQQQLLEEKQNHYSMVCVTAAEQSNGRGTSGRVWMGAKGNAFVTIAIQQQQWMKTKIPLTLLPLQIGIFVAKRVQQLIQECNNKMTTNNNELPFVTLKWPNVSF